MTMRNSSNNSQSSAPPGISSSKSLGIGIRSLQRNRRGPSSRLHARSTTASSSLTASSSSSLQSAPNPLSSSNSERLFRVHLRPSTRHRPSSSLMEEEVIREQHDDHSSSNSLDKPPVSLNAYFARSSSNGRRNNVYSKLPSSNSMDSHSRASSVGSRGGIFGPCHACLSCILGDEDDLEAAKNDNTNQYHYRNTNTHKAKRGAIVTLFSLSALLFLLMRGSTITSPSYSSKTIPDYKNGTSTIASTNTMHFKNTSISSYNSFTSHNDTHSTNTNQTSLLNGTINAPDLSSSKTTTTTTLRTTSPLQADEKLMATGNNMITMDLLDTSIDDMAILVDVNKNENEHSPKLKEEEELEYKTYERNNIGTTHEHSTETNTNEMQHTPDLLPPLSKSSGAEDVIKDHILEMGGGDDDFFGKGDVLIDKKGTVAVRI
eukprot:CAMPEP_0184864404 /NCGR_PEP_ID=MMETSP0580-20130426/14817_1 /TAXON_ID=1118495 /ORGANISM="Dactyliosolen fragilissimus" /LENGTH=431 /DNA_ID=CAMNT_0027363167 /DNA_START=53 /DNA_END=1349 /DNA_ORIENTATION=+